MDENGQAGYTPLAQRLRPADLSEVAGQRHLLGEGKVLSALIQSGRISNMIFFGPPGTGKTTVANIAAEKGGRRLHKLNGTTASTADIKAIIEELDTFAGQGGIVLYLDEIQYLNKKQQQVLLSYLESGRITMIASTTENPYFYVYGALLSRCMVFEFKPVEEDEIARNLIRGAGILSQEMGRPVVLADGAAAAIARAAGGDVRRSLNTMEIAALTLPGGAGEPLVITPELVAETAQRPGLQHDRDGDSHYDLLSAFQKSIRGSDENAGLYYLARLLTGGELISVCRRLMVIAAEDIGLAYPQAIAVVKACVDMAFQLGMPEAQIPLADAVILLCTSPKSNSGVAGIGAAMADVEAGGVAQIPAHLRDAHYNGAEKLGRGLTYQYPHAFPGHYVAQQYLPDPLKDHVYYKPGDNKNEQAAKAYMDKLKGKTP